MGFRVTLLSVSTQSSAGVLQSLGLTTTDESDEANESPFSGAPNGETYLIWANDDSHVISDEELLVASAGRDVLMLRVNETVMISEIAKFENGRKIWSLTHDSNRGPNHLAPSGSPPDAWQKIRDDLSAQALAEGDDEIDFVFDAPVILFQQLTGFRYNEVSKLRFVTLNAANPAAPKKPFWKIWS